MKVTSEAGEDDYDTDLLNTLYEDIALVLLRRPYDLLMAKLSPVHHYTKLQAVNGNQTCFSLEIPYPFRLLVHAQDRSWSAGGAVACLLF